MARQAGISQAVRPANASRRHTLTSVRDCDQTANAFRVCQVKAPPHRHHWRSSVESVDGQHILDVDSQHIARQAWQLLRLPIIVEIFLKISENAK